MNSKTETLHITYKFMNGNNEGSIISNKEFHVCYVIMNIDLIKSASKKIIGCFINPNDPCLDKDIESHIYYFKMEMRTDEIFNIADLLKSTLYSKNYSNHYTKKFLYDSKLTNKIIAKCVSTLKEKVLIE